MTPELAMKTFCVCMLAMAGSAWGRESVTITNNLPVNLKVSCHSADDYLAVQMLTPSSVYIFHFKQSIFGNTLFTCDFNAVETSHYAGIKVWEGFNYSNRKCSCTQCKWEVTTAGFSCNSKFISVGQRDSSFLICQSDESLILHTS